MPRLLLLLVCSCSGCLAEVSWRDFAATEDEPVEAEVHITAQEDVKYVGDDVNFTCTVRADAKPRDLTWFMYEQDVTSALFTTVQTVETPPESRSKADKKITYSSRLTIKKAMFNYTSIVRCKVRIGENRVFHLSTPMTITKRVDNKRLIGEPCSRTQSCDLEHSFCNYSAAGVAASGGVCQCDAEHPVYSSLEEPRCLPPARLEQRCEDSAQCASADNGSQCEEHVCRCRAGFGAESGRCVSVPDVSSCRTTNACLDGNAECVDGRCVCKAGYVLKPGSSQCEESGEQEFQMAVIGVSAVAVLLVLSGITAACYVINRRKEGAERY